jgi:hypothetical protein
MLGFDSRGLTNSNEEVTTKIVNLGIGHMARGTKISITFHSP